MFAVLSPSTHPYHVPYTQDIQVRTSFHPLLLDQTLISSAQVPESFPASDFSSL